MFIIYAVVLISASVSAFDFPTRQAIIPNLVPRERLADAVSLYMAMIQLTGIVGLTAGGSVIAQFGLANTYWIDVISYFVVIGSLLFMAVPYIPVEKRAQAGFRALTDGMRFLRTQQVILAISSLLHVGSQGLGILMAVDSIGALAVTPFAGRIGRFTRQGLGIVFSIIVWGVCIVAFGLFPSSLWISALLLACAGAANMISMILRFLVVQLITPDELRGRISSVNAMFAFGGPLLGNFESGLVASLTSPQFSIISGGVACIIATLAIVAIVPGLVCVHVKVESGRRDSSN